MADYGKGKMDWTGCGDGAPSSDPKAGHRPQDQGPSMGGGADWHGLDDATPESSPERGKSPQKG